MYEKSPRIAQTYVIITKTYIFIEICLQKDTAAVRFVCLNSPSLDKLPETVNIL